MSVPATHHKIALKLWGQPEMPVCELERLGIEVLLILPLLLKKVVSPKRMEAEMPEKSSTFGHLSRLIGVLHQMKPLYLLYC